jgi:hypothetical protein
MTTNLYPDPDPAGFGAPALDLPIAPLEEVLIVREPPAGCDEVERAAWRIAWALVDARDTARQEQAGTFYDLVAALGHSRRAWLARDQFGMDEQSRRFAIEAWKHLRLLGGTKRDLEKLTKWICWG